MSRQRKMVQEMIATRKKNRAIHHNSNLFLGFTFISVGLYGLVFTLHNSGGGMAFLWVIITGFACLRDAKSTYAKSDYISPTRKERWEKLNRDK